MYTKHKKKGPPRKLDRRNAFKNVDNEAPSSSPSSSFSSSSSSLLDRTCYSLDSYRIEGGVDGEVDFICRSLGFNGPDDFAISADDWAAHKGTCCFKSRNDVSKASVIGDGDVSRSLAICGGDVSVMGTRRGADVRRTEASYSGDAGARRNDDVIKTRHEPGRDVSRMGIKRGGDVEGKSGIKGVRPPLLARPPPVMSPKLADDPVSTWDLIRSFAPEMSEAAVVVKDKQVNGSMVLRNVVGESSLDVSGDDEEEGNACSTAAVEIEYLVSPHGSVRCSIKNWQKGDFLGSGSFGTVYEGFNE